MSKDKKDVAINKISISIIATVISALFIFLLGMSFNSAHQIAMTAAADAQTSLMNDSRQDEKLKGIDTALNDLKAGQMGIRKDFSSGMREIRRLLK